MRQRDLLKMFDDFNPNEQKLFCFFKIVVYFQYDMTK